ncbi:RNA-directed DNA polymerase, eukaryota [Tanacetum coccineum]
MSHKRFQDSNEDFTQKISHSIFVTNFPDSINSRDLWRECSVYGTVVDVFIPSKKSKVGSKQKVGGVGSYVKAVNGGSSVQSEPLVSSVPALVLDEECCVERDFSKFAMEEIIQDVIQDFASEERVVWVDIEGVPLHAWSRETFARIGKKWGETLSIEDTSDFSFGRKRLCIITKHLVSIFESFKVKVKGKVFMVRAKELFTWNPFFKSSKEKDYLSDDDYVHSEGSLKVQSLLSEEEEGEFNLSSVEGVAETIFGDNADSPLNQNEDIGNSEFESVTVSPPGFTPGVTVAENNRDHGIGEENFNKEKVDSPVISTKVLNTSQVVHEEIFGNSVGHVKAKSGESVLGILEEVIRVGQAMGFSMGGCEKDIEDIIGNQGEDGVFR